MTSRTNPFEALEQMFDRMSQQFEDAAGSWESGESMELLGGGEAMALDVVDRGDEFAVTINVPGFTKDDISVELADRTLRVEAERESESTEEDERYVRQEREQRRVSRSVRLPEPVEAEDVSATIEHGVLRITVPKAEPTTTGHQIEIE